ncbi:hypothetical protein AX15_001418 [Amanita polypyramis BW_CC]|nr:hypothetical protein AX15_001418 [Amanita polypyramis BW_CC]
MWTGLRRKAQPVEKHVFMLSSTMITVCPTSGPPRSGSAFRDAFTKRRPSLSSLNEPVALRSYPFSIPLPCSPKSGESLPPTRAPAPRNNSSNLDGFEISYRIIATWQPNDTSFDDSSRLEIPVHFQPESVSQSQKFATTRVDSWLELPLKSDHPISFWCAATLPTSVTFKRGSLVPYFVVFATRPRSTALANEIATDATVSVSLRRKVTMTKQVRSAPLPPGTPISPGDEAKSSILKRPRSGQLRSKTSSLPLQDSRECSAGSDSHPPRLPTQVVFKDIKTLKNDVCIGFPKRPRSRRDFRKHLNSEEIEASPDGLIYSKISLDGDLLPSIDVEGLSVKYYLDVCVLFEQDNLYAEIPIRIV